MQYCNLKNRILTLIRKQNPKINNRTSCLVLAIISLMQLRLLSWCSDGFPCLQCILSLCCHTSCRLVRRLLYAAAEVKFRPEPAMMADSQFWVFEFISWCCKGTCFLPKKTLTTNFSVTFQWVHNNHWWIFRKYFVKSNSCADNFVCKVKCTSHKVCLPLCGDLKVLF